MRDEYYWGVWLEVVAKRRCEVDAERATVGEANVLSERGNMRIKWAKNSSTNHLSYSTSSCLEKSPTVK